MTKPSKPLKDAQTEPEQVGKMDARRGGSPSIYNQISRRMHTATAHGAGSPKGRKDGSGRYARPQRVTVKAHVSRHHAGKAASSLKRHVSYLGRESASQDGHAGIFFDQTRDIIPVKVEVATWQQDRHHFRLIVSAENGANLPDLTAYTREVMRRVERDLGTQLQWVAANHYNTDDPHTHILVRGKRDNGEDLVIPRQYISQGIRAHASEVATAILGERTQEQVHSAKVQEVQAERFTSLDRIIERTMVSDKHTADASIDVGPRQRVGFAAEDRLLVVARLQFLEQLGLTAHGRGTKWHVKGDFRATLRALGTRGDIIKQLYSALGNEAGHVERMNAGNVPSAPIAGVIVAKGSVDEITELRFLVVRDAAGIAHYARVSDGEEYRRLQVGSIAALGGQDARRRQLMREVLDVSETSGGLYDSASHRSHLHAAGGFDSAEQVEQRVRSAASRLAFLAGHSGAGIERLDGGMFRIVPSAFAPFIARPSRVTDVQVVAAHTLNEQVGVHAWTWLDRYLLSSKRTDSVGADRPKVGGKLIEDAAAQRREWLVAQGYAAPLKSYPKNIRLLLGARDHLIRREQIVWYKQLKKTFARPVELLPAGMTVHGEFAGATDLYSGRQAVIATTDMVYVAPYGRGQTVQVGAPVSARREAGTLLITLSAGRSAGQDRSAEAGR